jgi:DNA-binding NarL/FixJ family response regulator
MNDIVGLSPKEAHRKAVRRRKDMLKLLAKGMSKSEIGRRYGISRQRVLQILRPG